MGLNIAIAGYILLVLCGIGILAFVLIAEAPSPINEKIAKTLSILVHLSILAIFLGIFIYIKN